MAPRLRVPLSPLAHHKGQDGLCHVERERYAHDRAPPQSRPISSKLTLSSPCTSYRDPQPNTSPRSSHRRPPSQKMDKTGQRSRYSAGQRTRLRTSSSLSRSCRKSRTMWVARPPRLDASPRERLHDAEIDYTRVTSHSQGVVGTLPKDKFKGKFVDEWNNFLKSGNVELESRDASAVLAGVLSTKDDEEVVSPGLRHSTMREHTAVCADLPQRSWVCAISASRRPSSVSRQRCRPA